MKNKLLNDNALNNKTMKTINEQGLKEAENILNNIYHKCWEDKSFISKLESDPINTLENFTNRKINKSISIVVDNQSSSDHIYLNIPRKIDPDSLELTDKQLEMVSGGSHTVCIVVTVAAAVLLIAGGYLYEKATHDCSTHNKT